MSNDAQQIVIVGSSFAGMTAALEIRRKLDERHRIVVLDPHADFTFIPSLIWLPFGLREPEDVTFPLGPIYQRKGIDFRATAATGFDLDQRIVHTADGEDVHYDKLLLATGPRLAFDKIPGLGPHGGHTQSVCTLDHALLARDAWTRFLENPGPVVVGTAQGGSCFGASYEFLFNVKHRIDKAGLAAAAPVTFVTAEPFLGHFGFGGVADSAKRVERFFERLGIEGIPSNAIAEVRDGEMQLEGGRVLPFAYSMIVPPFTGVDAIRATPGLGNPMGFVPIDDEFRHPQHRDVFAAGVDIAIAPPAQTPVPAGVPKTGQMSEAMARVAAHNIAADVNGTATQQMPLSEIAAVCVLDAGNNGIIFKADHVLGDSRHPHVMAGPQAHWAKVAFERYFLATRRRGMASL
ncbi:Sulfide-quinone reductase [Patulibacter medicamentivorans]|uniref:Sulfide-quinone reductase n=1 Tax=Patulibacter medicamentivorans TaxID=1097667 RepID=H0E334_9ACTN|nr:FAD-dependent oxidoreductase [Patulibacter medicamentivorans]EHN11900.1 Sulfide-quinone reductase [Patulibacter medicamentivorans]